MVLNAVSHRCTVKYVAQLLEQDSNRTQPHCPIMIWLVHLSTFTYSKRTRHVRYNSPLEGSTHLSCITINPHSFSTKTHLREAGVHVDPVIEHGTESEGGVRFHTISFMRLLSRYCY